MAYDDMGEYTPDADVADMYEMPDVTVGGGAASEGDWYNPNYAWNFINSAGATSGGYGADVASLGYGDEQMSSVASVSKEAAGTDNMVSRLFNWFDGQKDFTKGATVTLAGSFLKGLFSYGDEQRKMKSLEKSSEANMLRATTEANLAQQKMSNASSIGQTNFGAAPAGGLIYSNKLAERQKRAGGYGA